MIELSEHSSLKIHRIYDDVDGAHAAEKKIDEMKESLSSQSLSSPKSSVSASSNSREVRLKRNNDTSAFAGY